jgi:hypothetical protein
MIEASREDVRSIGSIIEVSYKTSSGPAGQPRQWGHDRTIYIPNVFYVQTGVDPKTGKVVSHGMTYQEYADSQEPDLEKYGYFEREIDRAVKVFGDLASVMSAWEARRWWITSINWDEETPNKPIPRDF